MKRTMHQATLIIERSAPCADVLFLAGCSLADLTRLGVSPLTFWMTDDWTQVLDVICAKDGYIWEWSEPGVARLMVIKHDS